MTELQRGRYGNITKMILPENDRKHRKSYTYAYDDERQLFVSSVRDNEKNKSVFNHPYPNDERMVVMHDSVNWEVAEFKKHYR